MAEFNFSCPHCHQLVQGDEQWSGQQIQCPSCNGAIVVPQNAAATPPPAAPPAPAPSEPAKPVSKLRVTAVPHAPAPPPPPPQPVAASRMAYAAARPKKNGDAAKWIKMSIVLLVCAVGGYFGFSYLSKWQSKANESKDDSGGGGEASHIVALNDVLDRTDPEHMGMSSKEAAAEERREKRLKARIEAEGKQMQANAATGGKGPTPEQTSLAAATAAANAEMANMPLASGVWALDTATPIPEGRANGMISGTNFVVDSAMLVKVGPYQMLMLREGTNVNCGMFVKLQLLPGEELAGHTWNISQEMRGKGVPQVTKSWKTDPKYAPMKKAFATGYAMKLEFGQATNGVIPGKISLSLPDPEQSYVVGAFKSALLTPAQ